MTNLVQHLHAFAREVRLTEAEWFRGIEFLTGCGHITNDKRQEFILLSDVLGLPAKLAMTACVMLSWFRLRIVLLLIRKRPAHSIRTSPAA